MDQPAYSCIAQISGGSGVKGAGFLVPGGHVITCAHVVNQALGRRNENAEQPAVSDSVRVVFPWSGDGNAAYVGRVVAWRSLTAPHGSETDIAVLKLEPAPPIDLQPAWLQVLERVHGVRVRTAGFPVGYTLGRHAQGRLEGSDGPGWLQAVSSPDDMTFLPGHSGAPVFLDEGGAVVAMVAMTDENRRDIALMIPTQLLRRVWPTLGEPTLDMLARNPYRGLEPFRAEHREAFYGRERYIAEVNRKLDTRQLVAVVGASGSGKSSLALAGVLPARADQGWLTTDFRPRGDPFRQLAVGLMPYLEPGVTDPGPILQRAELYATKFRGSSAVGRDAAQQGAGELVSLADLVLKQTKRSAFLILADQFEELFTQTQAQEREAFIALLAEVCVKLQSPIRWLLTLRADFMEEALRNARLTQLLQDADVKLGPMEEGDLRQAIRLPAENKGVRFAPGLVERLIQDTIGVPSSTKPERSHDETTFTSEQFRQAGRLPLLEFALDQLWQRQQGGEISHAAYDDPVLGIGGLDGALRRHAEAAYRELGLGADGAVRQERARSLFRRLVQRRQGGGDVRRVALRSEIPEDWNDLVAELAQRRLVITTGSIAAEPTVEIVHEELLRAWPELQQWVSANREFDLWREELTENALKWGGAGMGEKNDLLLRGTQLEKALVYTKEQAGQLTELEANFIDTSRQRRVEEQQERERQWRRRMAVAACLTLLAFLGAGIATWQWLRAAHEVDLATHQSQIARSRQLAAQSRVESDQHLDLALLLSIEALQLSDTFEARDSLLSAVDTNPRLLRYVHPETSPRRVALSSNRKLLAVATTNGHILLSPISYSDQTADRLLGHEAPITALAFSPDGSMLASGDQQGNVILWDVAARGSGNKAAAQLNTPVRSLAFSSDGSGLALANEDGEVFLWNLGSDPPSQPLANFSKGIVQLSFWPSPNSLTVASENRTIQIWDLQTKKRTNDFQMNPQLKVPVGPGVSLGEGALTAAAFSSDKDTIVWGVNLGTVGDPEGGGNLKLPNLVLWSLKSNTMTNSLYGHTNNVTSIVFSQDGNSFETSGLDGQVLSWKTDEAAPMGLPMIVNEGATYGLANDPSNSILAGIYKTGKIILWEPETSTRLGTSLDYSFFTGSKAIAFSADSKRLAFSFDKADDDSVQNYITILTGDNTKQTGDNTKQFVSDRTVNALAFSPDGRILASGGGDTVNPSLPLSGSISVDDLTAVYKQRNDIYLRDSDSGQIARPPLVGHRAAISAIAFSPDGRTLVSVDHDQTLIFWEFASGSMIGSPIHLLQRGNIHKLLFSPDGLRLYTCCTDPAVLILDVKSRHVQDRFIDPHHDAGTNDMALSADGTILATSSHDGSIILTDTESQKQRGRPFRNTGYISDLAFSPNGKILAGQIEGRGIALWDMDTGFRFRQNLQAHTDNVAGLAFKPDGKVLLSGGRKVILWNVALESWKSIACYVANGSLTNDARRYYAEDSSTPAACSQGHY